MKKRNRKSKLECRTYKTLFKTDKKTFNETTFIEIITNTNNFKKNWGVIKESIGKEKCSQQGLPKK